MRPERVLLALAACQGDAPSRTESTPTADTSVPCEGQGIELGTGVLDFETLQDNQTLAMIHGQQGGYHLPLAARACGVGESGLFRFVGRLPSGEAIVNVSLSRLWVPEENGCCSVALDVLGYIFLYDYTSSPPDLAGQTLQLTLEFDDFAGLVLQDQATIVLGAPAP